MRSLANSLNNRDKLKPLPGDSYLSRTGASIGTRSQYSVTALRSVIADSWHHKLEYTSSASFTFEYTKPWP